MPTHKQPLEDPAAGAVALETLDPRVAEAMRLILRIAGGDFTARGPVSERADELDAIVVGLNMLAESFERERSLRDRAELLLADAIDSYEHAPGLFCSVDVSTLRVVKCNQTLSDVVGRSKDQLLSVPILELCAAASRGPLERALRALAAGRPTRMPEVELPGTDGAPLRLSLACSVKRDPDGKPLRLRLSLRDVTAERRLEAQLLHAQKMEAVGQLAGGVAHDFNNLLLVIQCATDLLGAEGRSEVSRTELLAQIQGASDRAASLTRQLLTFARREVASPRLVDLAARIRESEGMLRRLLDARVALHVRTDLPDARVRIDPTRFDQALMNLVINARDAMPNGGTISIVLAEGRTTVGEEDNAWRACICVVVTDTGRGIGPEVLPRIFEPFFTTKPKGHGTGLGLSMVYGTIAEAGGETRVQSTPGQGATFELRLPIADPSDDEVTVEHDEGEPPGGDECVLVVDDEPDVRALVARVLNGAGYDAHSAGSGEEALALADALLSSVRLVISDVVMPGIPGPHLVQELQARYPSQRFILISGYPADHRLEGHHVLPKPFTPARLLRAVRACLDAPSCL